MIKTFTLLLRNERMQGIRGGGSSGPATRGWSTMLRKITQKAFSSLVNPHSHSSLTVSALLLFAFLSVPTGQLWAIRHHVTLGIVLWRV